MSRWVPVVFLASIGVACSGHDDGGGSPPPGTEPDPLADYPQGEYLLGLSIAPVGGLVIPFQIDATTTEDADGPLLSFDLRAVGAEDAVSDVLVTATDLPMDHETGFVAELPGFTLPAEYNTVTGSDVDVLVTLTAEQVSADGACGTVEGQLVTFGIDLAGSTFGSIPWERRAEGAPAECDAGEVDEIPRIETCPALTDGMNSGFPSGGEQRTFEVVLPSTYDDAQQYPLIFVYHGFGGTIASMLDAAQLRPYADDLGVILVVPQGQDLGGETGWDTFSDPLTNLDLALFDDLVTCATESFAVDPQRIHVTGMSDGGLETGYLLATRADVIASAAPMSGGVGVEPIPSAYAMPALVTWGGEIDEAFDLNFDDLAHEMITMFGANDQFVVACDHGLGHTLDPSFWPWVLQFLLDHPRDLATEPYAGGLPAVFPGYCTIE